MCFQAQHRVGAWDVGRSVVNPRTYFPASWDAIHSDNAGIM